jgi:GTP-binding protein EngB required for normal cell division
MEPSRPLSGVLDERVADLLLRERTAIGDLRALVARGHLGDDPERALATALEDLEGLFLLVVVGEFNAGKSTLVNALLGATVMREGVTPTTDRVTLVVHGPEATSEELSAEFARVTHPADRLRALALVDTPGTNAVIAKHQLLTEKFVPRADLVLFVTSSDRPFTESERGFLERIAGWGKKVAIVINKADLLESEEARAEVHDFVLGHARDVLARTPDVFDVAARAAMRARTAGDDAALEASGLPALERYLAEKVDVDRVRLKLDAGLGVALHVADEALATIEAQRALLRDDRRTLDDVDRQQGQWTKDLKREGRAYVDRVKTVLLEVERRGEVFFDDTVQLGKLLTLMRPEKVRAAFEARVLRGAADEIDAAVAALSDWFVERTLQQWEDVVGFVAERRKAGEERTIGEVGGRFRYDRAALIGSLRERAHGVLDDFDAEGEARRVAEALQAGVVQTGLMQVGGLGLGAAAVAIVSTAAWDVTGIAAGLTVMGLGLLVLPHRRRTAKRRLHEQMQALRDGLERGLGGQIDDEIAAAADRLGNAIAPYTRFVRTELERLEEVAADASALRDRLSALRTEVAGLERADPRA